MQDNRKSRHEFDISDGEGIKLINNISLLSFDSLNMYSDKLQAYFTGRMGGVSKFPEGNLNLSFARGDSKELVLKNYELLSVATGIPLSEMVISAQVHDNRVRVVDQVDAGKGILFENDSKGYDGLVTNVKRVALIAFYADCTPIYLYDTKSEVIGLVHAGWRSTVKDIMSSTVETMKEKYGCRTENFAVVIGPRIRECCFEVGEDVYYEYTNTFKNIGKWLTRIDNKWYIDNSGVIKQRLKELGVPEESIFTSDFCTKCRKDLFFSHRGDNGACGCQVAIMRMI